MKWLEALSKPSGYGHWLLASLVLPPCAIAEACANQYVKEQTKFEKV